ncbi:conserved Plasmodium protein, unknown function [Plasmodium gallinaceum]|uniref:Liprin-beta-1/2 coiled-coil domain-containing protein n=1 Tax=Plasmodium gallinaceum TaxID=5849 RepID=A0A1J1H4D9_PLAGA|nr:conserved Plasmodium protein, unknown function [Plasmodium gallinaceum]CRG98210.1 conserved Plasmodium protein, unknown function [Plasmodium gallinaceum]
MDKASKLNSLVKNVQLFVKKCREKNKKLLTLSSLDDTDEMYIPGNIINGKTNVDRSFKESSTVNSSKCSGESKYNIYKNFDNVYSKELRRTNTEDDIHNISDYSDNTFKKKFIKLKEKDSISETFEGYKKLLDTDKNNTNNKLGVFKERIKSGNIDDLKSKIMKYDLDLLKIYNKLETTTKNRSFRKKKKKKTLRTYNSEILNVKNELFVKNNSSVKKRNIYRRKKFEDKRELKINFSKETPKLSSKSSFLMFGNKISKFQCVGSSKKTFDEFLFFQEGLSNRLNKKNNTSSYDIGCMYMNSDISINESKDLNQKKSNDLLNSSKSLRQFKFLNNSKRNIDYYKKMIENLEETIGKTKKKNNSYIDDVVKIINCLLHDYVPKLIDRYEYYMNTLDDKNKILKQKIRESLDYGDIQYEEIRELKAQLIQKNNKNKKLNDTIEMLKDKLSYINELELKNAEYLDEIVLLRNRIAFLERIIEENDQTKESQELRRMRHNLRTIYNKMKNEMRYISTLKLKYLKKYKRRKFSINKWNYLKGKIHEKELTIDDRIEQFSVDVKRKQSENHINIEKDMNENIINENKKDTYKDKNEETLEYLKILKEYVDKSVGTDDKYIHEKFEKNDKAHMLNNVRDELKFERKIMTANKGINTVLSSNIFIGLLKKTKKGNNKMDNCSSIPMESYPYYHYFYSNINENNYFGYNNEEKKKIHKEKLNKENNINEKYSFHFVNDKNSKAEKELFLLGNVSKNPLLNYNEKYKKFNYNPMTLDEYSTPLYNNLKKYIYNYDKVKFNEDDMLKNMNFLEKNKLLNLLYENTSKSNDWNSINKKDKNCIISSICCDKLRRLLMGKMNCYLCKTKNIHDSSDNILYKKYKLKKSSILNNSSSIGKKLKFDEINGNILHSYKDNFKFKNRYNNNIDIIRNEHKNTNNIKNISNQNKISNNNCNNEQKYEDYKINNYYDNKKLNEYDIDINKDKNNDNQNMCKDTKNISKVSIKDVDKFENKNNDNIKNFNVYENQYVNNDKKILEFYKNQFNKDKNNNLISKLYDHENEIVPAIISSNKNKNSKVISNNKKKKQLNNREILIISEMKKNDDTISQINDYKYNRKINSYVCVDNNYNIQKKMIIHKKVSNYNNIHKNNLKKSNGKYSIKKKENLKYDLSNCKNNDIIISQSMEKAYCLKDSIFHKKDVIHNPYKEYKKNESFYSEEKNFRYYNVFNQYLDINKKNYGTINNYLHNNFLYIMEM